MIQELRSWCEDGIGEIFRLADWLRLVIEELRWRGIGEKCFRAYLVCRIILLSFLRLECRCEALEEKICWKLQTVYFLLGICCKAAVVILVWILCQVVSRDSKVSVEEGRGGLEVEINLVREFLLFGIVHGFVTKDSSM